MEASVAVGTIAARDRRASAVWFTSLVVFAASGFAGLIYQSVWAQYLGLFLGHAAYAQSLVLAVFMGGMALGAWGASFLNSRAMNLIRAYAALEFAIGLAALAFHPVYVGVTGFFYDVALPFLSDGWLTQALRWLAGSLLILPQAILLGATFPLFGNGLMRRLGRGRGAMLASLYFVNSIGAALGALVATFVLLPAGGLPGAMLAGAILNFAVAVVALGLSSRQEASRDPLPRVPEVTGASAGTLLLVAACITGLTSFVYEVGWVRMLCLALGSTVHAFELMLAAFIGGLAAGSFWIRDRIDRYGDSLRVGGHVQLMMGLAALTSLIIYDRSFDWVAWFMGALSSTENGYVLFNAVTMSTAVLIMAPTAFFAGMTLPLFTVTLLRGGGGESSLGRIYAANTLGAIAGVFLAVHLLVPLLGLKLTMISAAVGDLVLGLFLLRRTTQSNGSRTYLAALALAGVAVALTLVLARFDALAMAGGVYRSGVARLDDERTRMVFYRDGKTASVGSFVTADGLAMIATNGKVDASMNLKDGNPPAADETTMGIAAALPLAAVPKPRTAAVIGFGSGMSTHTLLGDSRLSQVDTIEIEPAMFDGARIFGDRVGRAFADPRSHVRFDDAKAWFAVNQARYDIILSEPSNPWVSGVASLFSREFYDFVPRHLQPDGVLVQWVQQYEITDELVATVINALAGSFEDFRIYLPNNWDILILAKPKGRLPKLQDTPFAQPGLRPILDSLGLKTVADLELREVGGREGLLPLFAVLSRRANSDFHPILSLEAPRARFEKRTSSALLDLNDADLPLREVLQGLPTPDIEAIQVSTAYAPSMMMLRAAQIAKALSTSMPMEQLPDEAIQGAVAFARATVGQCGSVDRGQAEIDTLVNLAGKTIPFLSSDRMQDLWSRPRWIGCEAQPPAVRAMLTLLGALSRRDFDIVQKQSVALLAAGERDVSPTARDWLLRLAMLSAIAREEYDSVRKLYLGSGAMVAPSASSALQRNYLVSYAYSRLASKAERTPALKQVATTATAPAGGP